jgi:putative DNA primase/helicase
MNPKERPSQQPVNIRNARVQTYVIEAMKKVPALPWGMGGKGKGPVVPTPADIAKYLIRSAPLEEHFAKNIGNILYFYVDGTYRPQGEEAVAYFVEQLFEKQMISAKWKAGISEAVATYIRHDPNTPKLWEKPHVGVINVTNGLLDLETRTLHEHHPGFLQPGQFSFPYDPTATCPAWDRQIAETWPEDAIEIGMPFQIVVAAMLPVATGQAVLLFGEGGSGKSRYLQSVISFIGEENISNVTFQAMEQQRFARASLLGKLVNVCADLPGTRVESSTYLKTVSTGDRIDAEFKFQTSFEFYPYCLLLFSANQYPESADATSAFFDRWIVVPFDRIYRNTDKERPREEIDAELAQPAELSGVLNRALDYVRDVKKGGVSISQSCREAHAQFIAATDPLRLWFEENLVVGPKCFVRKQTLMNAYRSAMEANERPAMSEKAFVKRLKQHFGSKIREDRHLINGSQQYTWDGIGLIEKKQDEAQWETGNNSAA